MALVKKKEFIERFLIILKRELEGGLPEEDFEYKMLIEAWEVVYKKVRHIKSVIEEG